MKDNLQKIYTPEEFWKFAQWFPNISNKLKYLPDKFSKIAIDYISFSGKDNVRDLKSILGVNFLIDDCECFFYIDGKYEEIEKADRLKFNQECSLLGKTFEEVKEFLFKKKFSKAKIQIPDWNGPEIRYEEYEYKYYTQEEYIPYDIYKISDVMNSYSYDEKTKTHNFLLKYSCVGCTTDYKMDSSKVQEDPKLSFF